MSLFINFLHRIIGVQSFAGSMRRTCVISPTLGEGRVLRDQQFCGGYIDPVSHNVTSYMQMDNKTSSEPPKGYICPLGQVCMVSRRFFLFSFHDSSWVPRNYQIPRTTLKVSMPSTSLHCKLSSSRVPMGYVSDLRFRSLNVQQDFFSGHLSCTA
jgi:hypothetical protein